MPPVMDQWDLFHGCPLATLSSHVVNALLERVAFLLSLNKNNYSGPMGYPGGDSTWRVFAFTPHQNYVR